MIDLDWIQRLIDMVDKSDIDSLEVSRFATRVRISKSPPVEVMAGNPSASGSAPSASDSPPPAAGPTDGSTGPGGEESGGRAVDANLMEVESPMVGTFYRAPAPDAPAYVEVGDRVRKGQTLCILEAMKLMNELEAEVAGTVREICIGNGEPVEYGQVLFLVEPD
jgi:acetyl-CoA carboxylase biotin carboxyl carrier protein